MLWNSFFFVIQIFSRKIICPHWTRLTPSVERYSVLYVNQSFKQGKILSSHGDMLAVSSTFFAIVTNNKIHCCFYYGNKCTYIDVIRLQSNLKFICSDGGWEKSSLFVFHFRFRLNMKCFRSGEEQQIKSFEYNIFPLKNWNAINTAAE